MFGWQTTKMSRLTALEQDNSFWPPASVRQNAHPKLFHTKAEAAYVAKAMKTSGSKSAFTLIELLVVIFVVMVLFAIFLPSSRPKQRAYALQCMSNQKQIALGYLMWEGDHDGRFAWLISTNSAGTMESAARGYVAPNFQILSNYLGKPNVLVCPTDKNKTVASNFAHLDNQNVSYFNVLDPSTNLAVGVPAVSILTGDRHLECNSKPLKPGLFVYSNGFAMNWTHELHGNGRMPFGCLSFVDGHAQAVNGESLTSVFQSQGSATNRLAVP